MIEIQGPKKNLCTKKGPKKEKEKKKRFCMMTLKNNAKT